MNTVHELKWSIYEIDFIFKKIKSSDEISLKEILELQKKMAQTLKFTISYIEVLENDLKSKK